MQALAILLFSLIVLSFLGLVYAACLAWHKMKPGKRIVGLLLLTPHLLLIASIVTSLLCGHPPQGSPCFNTQFFCGVLMVFILPLPALVGSAVALGIFKSARVSS